MNLKNLQLDIYRVAKEHGCWDDDRPVPEMLCLIHSEISEALEAYRNHDEELLAEELADVVIRTLDTAAGLGIDLEAEILRKHDINKARPYRHGGKAC